MKAHFLKCRYVVMLALTAAVGCGSAEPDVSQREQNVGVSDKTADERDGSAGTQGDKSSDNDSRDRVGTNSVPGQLGGACGGLFGQCASLLYCVNGFCRGAGSAGDFCGNPAFNPPCASYLTCVNGICRGAGSAGDFCGNPQANPPCASYLTCVQGICRGAGGPGDACGTSFNPPCGGGLTCYFGVCRAP